MRYFEDFSVGECRTVGEYTVTEDEILEFAERYDPQPYHTDPEAAADSFFGELVASGWHSAAIAKRLIVEHIDSEVANCGGLGVDELRWHRPVVPGDTLSVRQTVDAVEAYENRPECGLVVRKNELLNQDADVVMSWYVNSLIERAPA